MIQQISFVDITSTFVIMFAIIDVTGSIPVFLNIKQQKKSLKTEHACLVSLLLFISFFFAGDALLKLFNVDVASFAIAGSMVIFILSIEMILGIEIIKNENLNSGATIVPVAFPLIAGPGALTTLLSLRAEYAVINIMTGLVLNILLVYFVLKSVEKIEKILGESIIFILRKFFGVLLLAISVKLFASNLFIVINNLS